MNVIIDLSRSSCSSVPKVENMMEGRRFLETFKNLIPPLSHSSYKGQSGKIGVIGGSSEYTGAPYFAAMSAMRAGGDLSHVFCPISAAGVIKTYSPDLIVHPLLSNNSIESVPLISSWFSRLHAIVVGPGLGRDKGFLETAKGLIWSAVMQQKPLVIDADGLYLLCQEPELVKGYERAILTPNAIELQRLYTAVFKEDIPNVHTIDWAVQSLAKSLGGVTIVLKGEEDIISNGIDGVIKCTQKGSPRRCGGQGDLLSGVMTLFLFWAMQNKSSMAVSDLPGKAASKPTILASYAACHLIKVCGERAFSKHKRSMVASDMMTELPHAFEEIFEKN